MPFSGNGTFNRLYSWTVDAANSVNISSSRSDAELNGIAAALSNCITRDGQSPPSADIPWGGKRLMNIAAAAAGSDALNRDTADARYVLASGAVNLTLTGTLVAVTLTISGNGAINGNVTVGTNAGGGNSVFLNGASGTQRGISFQTAGSYAADITLQTDNTTIAYKAAGAHTFSISGSQVASITSTGLSITGVLAVSGAATGVTASPGDNSTKFATTAFVTAAISASSPSSLSLSGTLGVSGQTTLTGVTGLPNGFAVNGIGYMGAPSTVKTANYQLAASDIGQDIAFNGTSLICTIPAGLPNGYVAIIANLNASSLTITSASDTLTWSGTTTTGNRTLGQNGEARIIRRNGVFYIGGTALS